MQEHIKNFCIIAHIDHGKSTLADRMLELTGTIKKTDHSQTLDTMDLEQERGITIKMTPARMQRKGQEFNLIDTPGHADFQYEVSRSLAAVEGVILLVDASQGIQAQTLSTLYMAMNNDLEIIPVLNKIDLPAADPERVGQEIENLIGVERAEILQISAKTGQNVDLVLDEIIKKIPAPTSLVFSFIEHIHAKHSFARALIFDSIYDRYKGVVIYVKVLNGSFKRGDLLHLLHSATTITPTEVGFLTPKYTPDKTLREGQIGYIVTGKRSVRDAQIGDTLIGGIRIEQKSENNKKIIQEVYSGDKKLGEDDILESLIVEGFAPATPFVFAGVYPIDTTEYDKLKEGFEKLMLNDSALQYTHETSKALGFGFRCGFLGLLHMDIIRERLSREYNIETIFTTPTVSYLVQSKSPSLPVIKEGRNLIDLVETGLWKQAINFVSELFVNESLKDFIEKMEITESSDQRVELLKPYLADRLVVKSGADMVTKGDIQQIFEPMAEVEIVGPEEFAGNIMSLCQDYRGSLSHMEHIDETRIIWKYLMPMGEIIIDFNDRLKSSTKGYATMNYEFSRYNLSDLVKLDVFINGEIVEAFSLVIHETKAYYLGRDLVKKLKELIPKHMFAIPLQAGIGSKMIARETISAMRKDVIAKCYGGDISRKKKLLKKQKEGKKKMKALGSVSVPPDVFIKMVTRES